MVCYVKIQLGHLKIKKMQISKIIVLWYFGQIVIDILISYIAQL